MSGAVTSETPVLSVRGLSAEFRSPARTVRAVDGLSLDLARGETLAVVGESGCGKSATALSIMGLIGAGGGTLAAGSIRLAGAELVGLPEPQMRAIRGREMSMIFQEPMTSLNPTMRVGYQIAEALLLHTAMSRRAALARAVDLLDLVGIPAPRVRARDYPHHLSGGMRQRVMIAMALACEPKLLIADEPTTALDVTIQAQILDLIVELKERLGTSVLLITHNFAVVAETAQRVLVMYGGRKIEEAPVEVLFAHPAHPYTVGLMAAVPAIPTGDTWPTEMRPLPEMAGTVPRLDKPIERCAFAERCALAHERCRTTVPPLREIGPAHSVACFEAERVLADPASLLAVGAPA